MKLSDHATVVAGIGQQLTDKRRRIWKRVVAVARVVDSAGVHARHKAGTTGCANRALAIRRRKCHAICHELVDRGSVDIRIAKSGNRVEALLVGAVPQDVWTLFGHVRAMCRGKLDAGGATNDARQHRSVDSRRRKATPAMRLSVGEDFLFAVSNGL